MENGKQPEAKVVQLRTQLVREGHTRELLAETDLTVAAIGRRHAGGRGLELARHIRRDSAIAIRSCPLSGDWIATPAGCCS